MKKIFFCDFETITSDTDYFKTYNKTGVWLYYLQSIDKKQESMGVNIQSLFKYLKKLEENCIVYFHNLSFDGDFILKWMAVNGVIPYNQVPNKCENGFSFVRQKSKIYEIQYRYKVNYKKYITITFRCTLCLFSSGIEKLGKDIGINKYIGNEGDNFYKVEPKQSWRDYDPKYIEYIKRDVEIMRQTYINFALNMENIKKNSTPSMETFDWKQKLTIGSMAYKIQNNYVKDLHGVECYKGLKITEAMYEVSKKFFNGGFCQFNSQIQEQELMEIKGSALDINSAYPFNMCKPMPYGDIREWSNERPENGEDHVIFYEIYVKEAVSNNFKVANLLNWNKKINKEDPTPTRYCYHLEKFTCYYLKEEWDILQKFYNFKGVKIIKKYWFKAKPMFKECIEELYKLKQQYSKLQQPGIANIYKILLNAMYGKHATRMDFEELFVFSSKQEYDTAIENGYGVFDSKIVKLKFFNQDHRKVIKLPGVYMAVIDNEEVEVNKKYYNKWIASTITAYNRVCMFQAILDCGIDNFLYCDTDGLYVINYVDNLQEHPDKLGCWKREMNFDKFYVMGAKVYYAKQGEKPVITKFAGVNKKWLKDNFDSGIYKSIGKSLINSKLRPVRLDTGIIIEPADYTVKPRTI